MATEQTFLLPELILTGSLFSTTCLGSFLGSFFPQVCIFNNFPASFLGSFRFVFGSQSCVFNNFLGSFFKKGILFNFPLYNRRIMVSFCAPISASRCYDSCLPPALKLL